MKVYFLLFFCLCFMFGCAGDEPELEIALINEEDTPNYHYYNYSVQVREKSRVCDVKHLAVNVELIINGKVSQTNTIEFQHIEKGKISVKSDSVRTYGREASDVVTLNVYKGDYLGVSDTDIYSECDIFATNAHGRPYNGKLLPTF